MNRRKVKPVGEHQPAGDEETDVYDVSAYQYTPKQDICQVLALADVALARARGFRAEFLATGDARSWRLWRACLADREALLGEVGR